MFLGCAGLGRCSIVHGSVLSICLGSHNCCLLCCLLLSLTMLMLLFSAVEVARVLNSRNMVAWSLLMAAFSRESALSCQYLFWSCCKATLRRRDKVLYSGMFPAGLTRPQNMFIDYSKAFDCVNHQQLWTT